MSRLKRQRLNINGDDRITAVRDVALEVRVRTDPENRRDERTEEQSRRSLFVHSLPASADTERLTAFFSQSYPLKHATVVVDPATKISKGYGFVTFADSEDARNARETLNQSLFDGQKIKVELAEPRHRQGAKDDSTNAVAHNIEAARSKADVQPPTKLIVRNLPWTIKDSDQLSALFRSYGKVKHATIPKKRPGLSAGFGFVVLRGRKNAEKALEGVNGKEIDGRTIAVDWAVQKDVWEGLQHGRQEPEAEAQVSRESTEHCEEETLQLQENGDLQGVGLVRNDLSASDSETSSPSSNEDHNFEMGSGFKASNDDPFTLFVRNLPFTCTDEILQDHFRTFGAVRYARVVLDPVTQRSKGTGFVCFFKSEDAESCLRGAPRPPLAAGIPSKSAGASSTRYSLLEDTSQDISGHYTIDGRVLQLSRAVDRNEATRLTYASSKLRNTQDKDKRRLYLLSEGTLSSDSPLYGMLSATEVKMREDSARQRQSLIKTNPTLHLSLTRLSVRNLPRNVTSKDLKALAREAAVGFAKDVKTGVRKQLSKEELSRGGEESKEAEKSRKAKGRGIVKQAKVVYEGREGAKVTEESGAGRSRGYGFIEYSSHRWALMGLRWLNGHLVSPSQGTTVGSDAQDRKKRLIVEFAIENAQVVGRRLDREAKARERSRLVSEKRGMGEAMASAPKALSRNQIMAKTRKGSKGKKSDVADAPRQKEASTNPTATKDSDKASKRQQIIGRKRMMRKQRARPSV